VDDTPIARRKNEHLALALGSDAAFRESTTLLEEVQLVHDALPDLSLEQIETTTTLLGHTLRFPLVIAGMTGGSSHAREINRTLASIAQERGYGFGLGSQRAMLVDKALTDTYRVRDVAPDALLLGNIGVVQARAMSTEALADMLQEVGADALCVHLNAAQELVQPEGDRDFRGGAEALSRLCRELPCPVVAKETGCGISGSVATRLFAAGVRHVDVSGAGGTSWVAIESQRAQGVERKLGRLLGEWGIPTAASLLMVRSTPIETVIATGGIATGLDVARAVVLGANAAGVARPVLRALASGGREGAAALLQRIEAELRAVMLLTGCRDLSQLARCPRLLGPKLERWARFAAA
jgi:isopentenyl-diphosphate Delta-isomerase